MYEIVENMEVPRKRGGRTGGTSKYPFATMKVGSGFEFEGSTGKHPGSHMYNAVCYFCKSNPSAKFTIRRVGDSNTYRCIRIA